MKPIYRAASKRTLVIRASLFVSLLFSSFACSEDKFLDLVPQDRLDKTNFFKTDVEVVTAINGVYATQRNIYGNYNVFILQEARSDNASQNQNDQPERVAPDIFAEQSGNLLILDAWTNMYNLVNLANAVIGRSGAATGNQALVARAIAEAKFLRAMTYFQMVTLWGDVPLRTTETVDFSNTTLPRTPAAKVYDQIVADLNEASSTLPNTYDDSKFNEKGRATRDAALTLLGKVELQRGNKPAAAAALRQLLKKYSLLPNYADVHAAENENSAESIFEVGFNPANQTGLGLPGSFIPQSEATRLGIAAGGVGGPLPVFPTQDLVNAYTAQDKRKSATVTLSVADGKPYISKFKDVAAVAQGHNVNLVVLRYADVLLMLAEAIGESPEAYEYINLVRQRAGLGPIGGATPGSFLEKLMSERQLEFAFEQHRWEDLRRLAPEQTLSLMTAHLSRQLGKQFTLTNSDLLFPIPATEIEVSKGIVTQNPGY